MTTLYVLLVIALMASGASVGSAAVDPLVFQLSIERSADVCGSKDFIVALRSSRPLTVADSLQGFDAYVGFNTAKVQVVDVLRQGTHSARFSDRFFVVDRRIPGFVGMSGFVSSGYLNGDLPLIAILCRYRPDCEDTSLLTIADFIPAYEFGIEPRRYTVEEDRSVLFRVSSTPERRLVVRSSRDTVLVTDSAGKGTLSLTVSTGSRNRLDSVRVKVCLSDTLFRLKLDSISGGSVIKSQFAGSCYQYDVQSSDFSAPARLWLTTETSRNATFEVNARASIEVLGKCTCISDTSGVSVLLKRKSVDTTVSSAEAEVTDDLVIAGPFVVTAGLLRNIVAYDLLGRQVYRQEIREETSQYDLRELAHYTRPLVLVVEYSTGGNIKRRSKVY